MIREELNIGKFDPREIGFNKLSSDDQLLLKELEKNNRIGFDEYRIAEFLKCRQNPFYFIHNYIYLSEVGGGLLYTSEMMNPKAKRVIKSLHKYHKCIFMASRQLGKMLDLDTPIPLPNGEWKTLSDIHPGDYVLDNYNLPTKVLWESEIFYDKLCYELEFDCGEKIIAGEDHLWRISSITKQDEVIDTKTIYELNDKSIYVFRNYDYKKFYIKNIIPIAPVPCKCIAVDNEDKLFLCGKSMIPTHNSTLMAAMLVWALTFYPGNKGIILNMDMAAGIENINKIKFMLENLPSWLKFIPKRASQHKTRVELSNDSAISVVYPSTIKTPDQLARSLTIPILYGDEIAFIRHIELIFGSAQQTLATARDQAIKNNYPYFISMTSTPNGTEGIGKFFYDYWENAVDSDLLFEKIDEKNEKFVLNSDDIINDPNKNSFVKVKFHWSEDDRKTEDWYQTQRKELNFNSRRINQELDIQFVGSSDCIFSDETLTDLQKSIQKPIELIPMPNQTFLKLFKEINDYEYYLVGVDTASSVKGAFNAIQIFSFQNFEQVAEMSVRLGSLTKYGEVVDGVCKYLNSKCNGRFLLVIENNSIGKTIVEHVTNHVTDFNYYPHLYFDKNKQSTNGSIREYGVNTNGQTKDFMVSALYELVLEMPNSFKSEELITQFHTINRSNSGTISSNSYSDLFMASCFCAYARKHRFLEIAPLIQMNAQQTFEKKIEDIHEISKLMSPKEYIRESDLKDIYLSSYDDYINPTQNNDSGGFFPFF